MTQRRLFDSFVEALVLRGYGARITPRLRLEAPGATFLCEWGTHE